MTLIGGDACMGRNAVAGKLAISDWNKGDSETAPPETTNCCARAADGESNRLAANNATRKNG
ncbi:hypothetical protein WJ972_05825 [Achromobacter insuavis]